MTVQTSTLPNGLRIVTDTMPELKTASIGIWVNAGARAETPDINGIAHMLEHMAFKGTTRRSARLIAEEIEQVGGHLNAYTSREQTAYYARILAQDVPIGIDILADILQHSTFAPDELERERQVIIQEIGQTDDTPDDIIFDLLQAEAYPDQPLGQSILGTEERVRRFQKDDLQHFMQAHYRPSDMVLSAAGGISHTQITDLAVKTLTKFSQSSGTERVGARYIGGDAREIRDLEQAHFALAFEGVSFTDPDFYAMQVYATLLGGGMSSRLFQEVREKRGLAYSIYSFSTSYFDSGLLTIYAGSSEQDAGELAPIIAEEMHRIGDTLEEREVHRARAQLKAGLLMSLESPSSRAEQMARQTLIYGRPLTLNELIAAVDAIQMTDIRRVASRVLKGPPVSVATLGPIARIAPHDQIISLFAG